MSEETRFVVCDLEGRSIALALEDVERVVRMVEITAVPERPARMLGLVNYGGQFVPVVSLREAFGVEEQEPEATDHLVLARAGGRLLALPVTGTVGVAGVSREMIVAGRPLGPGLHAVEGVFATGREIALILDLGALLGVEAWEAAGKAQERLSKGEPQ